VAEVLAKSYAQGARHPQTGRHICEDDDPLPAGEPLERFPLSPPGKSLLSSTYMNGDHAA
jgi:hypothetical protein